MKVPKAELRAVVAAALAAAGDDEPFADDESLVVPGRLASMDVVAIVVALEEKFGVEIHADDFDPLRFDSVDSIAALLADLDAG